MKPFDASASEADPPPVRRGMAAWDRVAWVVGDQALASATNIGTAVVAARSLDRQGFGAFGLAFAVYLLSVGGSRALVTEPLVSVYSDVQPSSLRPAIRAATGAATALGIAVAAVLAAVAASVGGATGRALGALAVVLPGLLLQDAWRYCFVASARPRAALTNDAIWCTTQVAVLVVLAALGPLTLVTILLWWGVAGVIAGLAGCVQAGALPALSLAPGWLKEHRHLSGRYAMEFLTATGAAQATLLGLGTIAGLAALGAVRGAQVFFGPINVLFGGIYLALAAEGRRLRAEPRQLRRVMATASAALIVAGAAWLLVGTAMPISVGRYFFGDTWGPSRQILVPVGLAVLGGGAAAGGIAGLRALAAARASLRARLLGLPVALAVPLVGAVGGARGFALGLAVATWAGAVIWWWQFDRTLAHQPPLPDRDGAAEP